ARGRLASGVRDAAHLVVKKAVVGVVAVLLYLAAAAMMRMPVRPLYDGAAPMQPYRWACPPPDFAKSNQKPKTFNQTIDVNSKGIVGASIQTDDSQATLIVPERSFPSKQSAKGIRFRIVPFCPTKLKSPGKVPQGNAYR